MRTSLFFVLQKIVIKNYVPRPAYTEREVKKKSFLTDDETKIFQIATSAPRSAIGSSF